MSEQDKHWIEKLAEVERDNGPAEAAAHFLCWAEEFWAAEFKGGYPAVVESVPGYVAVASADENGEPELEIFPEAVAVQWYRDAVQFYRDAANDEPDREPPDIAECMQETRPVKYEEGDSETRH